jgi:uncharacterized protein YbgA (DUF1722 family)/uncharacterized protein YbbK (DUF523 family)
MGWQWSAAMKSKDSLFSSDPTRDPIRVGISACLLGEKVRFDGGHKHDRYLTQTLGPYFEWVPVCPEVEMGLGTPRETMRLEQAEDGIRMVMPKSGRDLTRPMREYARERVEKLALEDLGGYILKSDSPSCGLMRVRVYGPSGMPSRTGRGLFAEALANRFPYLPIEEEGRLSDPRLRENWIERVFAYRRVQSLWGSRWTVQSLVAFHAAHKLVILAHSPKALMDLGRLVAGAKDMPRAELRKRYHEQFMSALAILATPGRHANVLQHMAGYLKKQLDEDSRRELSSLIDDYRNGEIPLVVPLTLLKHYVRRFDIPYLAGQVYLSPHPKELALHNHV